MDAIGARPALEQFFDRLSDGVLLFDRRAQVTFANTAALRRMPGILGTPIGEWQGVLGAALVDWLRHTIAASPGALRTPGHAVARAAAARRASPTSPPPAVTADGRSADAAWQVLGTGVYALRLQWRDAAPPDATSSSAIVGPVIAELMQVLWHSPFPAMLQDTRWRIVDVNPAFTAFSGFSRDQLVGTDPVALEPEEDRSSSLELRERGPEPADRESGSAWMNRRLIAADGRERWFRATRSVLTDENGRVFTMSVLQDSTAEHIARERADRSAREIDDWFDLSPIGMVLFDDTGLLVRTNPAFDALAGVVPAVLTDATPELRQLLGWTDSGPSPALQPAA
ncbi:MAG: PAS domain S-box protein, partial [Burkholderiaceae bacterium]|nr:PAS domain S-box protein [Burkholderiaceae bacterium]